MPVTNQPPVPTITPAPQVSTSEGLPPIGYCEGKARINKLVEMFARQAGTEILIAQPGGARSATSMLRSLPKTLACLERKVSMRTLYQNTAVFSEPVKEYVRLISEHGAEVRTLPDLPFERIMVFDRRVAVFPVNADRSQACILTERAIVRFMADAFDRAWSQAVPFEIDAPHRVAPAVVPQVRLRIKRLMVEGFDGDAIARRVGLKRRAYDSHVAAIKAEYGAKNLVQLGYLLASRTVDRGDAPHSAHESRR
jgi:hypothetical protein